MSPTEYGSKVRDTSSSVMKLFMAQADDKACTCNFQLSHHYHRCWL